MDREFDSASDGLQLIYGTNFDRSKKIVRNTINVGKYACFMLRRGFFHYNGTVYTVERDRRPGGVQMITFTEKLKNLKYELLMAYFDRDIQFLSFLLIECRNMIIHEIFISNVKIIIRFVRKYVSKIEIRFIEII